MELRRGLQQYRLQQDRHDSGVVAGPGDAAGLKKCQHIEEVIGGYLQPVDAMGELNAPYGICGFTTTLYAVYDRSPKSKKAKLAAGAYQEMRMKAEIKTYLNILRAEKKVDLLAGIVSFTR